MFIQTEATPNPATLKFLPGRAGARDRHARHAGPATPPRNRRWPSGCSTFRMSAACSSAPTSSPSPRPTATGSRSSRRSSAPSWSISCPARRCSRPAASRRRRRRILRRQGRRDRRHHQGPDRDARAPGGRQRRRRHHLPGLQGRRRLSAHEGRLLGLPVLDRDAAARHPEPAASISCRTWPKSGRSRRESRPEAWIAHAYAPRYGRRSRVYCDHACPCHRYRARGLLGRRARHRAAARSSRTNRCRWCAATPKR